ncbi:MAG: hypothetical protein KAG14_04845 [Mycoplasmataceae bacterium]|nr:hypothetical protein [Mycoplasmataceae bacterium]
MNKRIKNVIRLAKKLDIDINSPIYEFKGNIEGSFTNKIILMFETEVIKSKFYTFDDNRIKSDWFDKSFKRGSANTYYYLNKSLVFFGLLNHSNIPYDESKMLSYGWKIPEISKYSTFKEYVLDPNTSSESIFLEQFKKIIYSAMCVYLTDDLGDEDMPFMMQQTIIEKEETFEKFISSFKKLFEYSYMFVFKEEIKIKSKYTRHNYRAPEITRKKENLSGASQSAQQMVIEDYENEHIASVKEGGYTTKFMKVQIRKADKIREQIISKRGWECEICKINLKKIYKEKAVIHLHHINMLSKTGEVVTREEDLLLLCPTCHCAIHKSIKEPITAIELSKIMDL